MQWLNIKNLSLTWIQQLWVLNVSKRTDTCIERWWQGVSVGEVEPTTKVINATRTIRNFQKPACNVKQFYFGALVGTLIMYPCRCRLALELVFKLFYFNFIFIFSLVMIVYLNSVIYRRAYWSNVSTQINQIRLIFLSGPREKFDLVTSCCGR